MSDNNRHPLRCETCEYFPAGSIFDERCPYSHYTWKHAGNHPQCIKDPWLASDIWQVPIDVMSELTSDIGCASHSSAQDRIDAVIKELEQRVKNAQMVGGYPMMSVYEAIALLQGGEGK